MSMLFFVPIYANYIDDKAPMLIHLVTCHILGLNFYSNNPALKKILDSFAIAIANPNNIKGLPISSKVKMEFIGMDGKVEKVEATSQGFDFVSENVILNKLFADVSKAFKDAIASWHAQDISKTNFVELMEYY